MTPSRALWQPTGSASVGRAPMWAILAILFAVSIAIGSVMGAGYAQADAAVKGILLLTIGTAAGALVWYRPVLFPLSLYFIAIPFDSILQTGSGTMTKFLGIGSVGVLALVLIDHRRTRAPAPGILVWVAYLLWCLASMMWSQQPQTAWSTLAIVMQLFGVYVLVALLRPRVEEVRFLAGSAVVGGFASALYGIWLFAHSIDVSANRNGAARLNIAIGNSMSINADHYAGALVLPIALSLVAALSRNRPVKIAGIVALMAELYGIGISGTRGAEIAVAVMIGYLLVMHPRRLHLLVLSGIGFVCSLPILHNVWLRFTDPTQADAGGRYQIWKVAFDSFRHHWLHGVGFGQFRIGYTESYLHVHLTGPIIHSWSEDSHNLLASTSVELGIVGVILILAAWAFQFRATAVVPRGSPLFDLRLGVEAGIIGLFIVAMTVDLMWFKYLWLAFMLSVLVRNARMSER